MNRFYIRMKTFSKYFIIGSLLLCFGSCSSFLDVEPTDRYTDDNYWETEERVVASLNGVYASLLHNGLYGGTTPLYFENLSPNAYRYQGDYNLVAQGQHNANTALFYTVWQGAYQGIGRANNLLANIGKVEMDESRRKRYIAEAKFLRAVFYFPLWNLFGGAPLILDATNDATQSNLPRNTAEEIYTQLLRDLNEAIPDLPASYGANEKGRATSGAALAFKARILLYARQWEEAAKTAKEVIDANNYQLFPDYRGLFYLENEGNEEVIFDVQFKFPEFTHGFDINLDQYNNIGPLPNLVNDYYDREGKNIGQSNLYDPAKPYENRDPRLQATVIVKGSLFKGAVVTEGQYPRTGYGQKKYTVFKDDIPAATIPDGQSELNYILLRYADVLLMYAEAQNEAYGPDQSVYNALQQIRSRIGMPGLSTSLSQDELRREIRHERRIELAGEGLYYYDIRRWGIAQEVLNGDIYNDKGQRIDTRRFDPQRDNLWPIPAIAIQENPILAQNPGYGN
ncbi:RagB/SusD family nutrient uptake outer membrane protein [Olivibacter sp. LS-1]|nr:RagB/SusD family nutrient uptake outer membrane protein [Olivibacter sp. LS-1]